MGVVFITFGLRKRFRAERVFSLGDYAISLSNYPFKRAIHEDIYVGFCGYDETHDVTVDYHRDSEF